MLKTAGLGSEVKCRHCTSSPARLVLSDEPSLECLLTRRTCELCELLLGELSGGTVWIVRSSVAESPTRLLELLQISEREALLVVGLRDGVTTRICTNGSVIRFRGFVILSSLQIRVANKYLDIVGTIRFRKR